MIIKDETPSKFGHGYANINYNLLYDYCILLSFSVLLILICVDLVFV